MIAGTAEVTARRVLARREMNGYARSPLFWIGAAASAMALAATTGEDDSSTFTMIAPAACLGVLGIVIMAGLTRRSDRAAAAAGAVSVGEHDRTLALAWAALVPLAAALLWFAAAVVLYVAHPPADWAVPFGELSDVHVLASMFALSVMPAAGGPVIGLLVARWLPKRGSVVVAVVAIVLVTILLQGNFESTWRWRVIWPWTYWYGPVGWSTGDYGAKHWMALPGSPVLWIGYLTALCVLGLLVALRHDTEADRARLTRFILVTAVVACLLLGLTMVLGLDAAIQNPVPAPGA